MQIKIRSDSWSTQYVVHNHRFHTAYELFWTGMRTKTLLRFCPKILCSYFWTKESNTIIMFPTFLPFSVGVSRFLWTTAPCHVLNSTVLLIGASSSARDRGELGGRVLAPELPPSGFYTAPIYIYIYVNGYLVWFLYHIHHSYSCWSFVYLQYFTKKYMILCDILP